MVDRVPEEQDRLGGRKRGNEQCRLLVQVRKLHCTSQRQDQLHNHGFVQENFDRFRQFGVFHGIH